MYKKQINNLTIDYVRNVYRVSSPDKTVLAKFTDYSKAIEFAQNNIEHTKENQYLVIQVIKVETGHKFYAKSKEEAEVLAKQFDFDDDQLKRDIKVYYKIKKLDRI